MIWATDLAEVVSADSADADELAAVAARTFPLACPPSVADEHIFAFIDAHLSPTRFADYLADPQRAILKARHSGRIIGYAMLIRDASDASDAAVELSKLYVEADFHGTGVSTALLDAALADAADCGARRVWLGVNQKNQRAQRFYIKSGFTVSGTRTFRLGNHLEDDYVMSRAVG